jgi:hypothetical protein
MCEKQKTLREALKKTLITTFNHFQQLFKERQRGGLVGPMRCAIRTDIPQVQNPVLKTKTLREAFKKPLITTFNHF